MGKRMRMGNLMILRDGSSAVRRGFLAPALCAVWSMTISGQTVNEFRVPRVPSLPTAIAAGPDGNLWFADGACCVGRVTPRGGITLFPVPLGGGANSIARGQDGNLWFCQRENQFIGRITPDGVITQFVIPTFPGHCGGMTAGPDGNVWFTENPTNPRLGRITPAGTITEFQLPFGYSNPLAITAGQDGNLWLLVSRALTISIGRSTTAGAMDFFPLAPGVLADDITAGPDGNVWFAERTGTGGRVGSITPSGVITEYPLPTSLRYPNTIAAGPDGNLWIGGMAGDPMGVVSTSGSLLRAIPIPASLSGPFGITAGPEGNIWFTLPFTAADPSVAEICRVNLPPVAVSVPTAGPIALAVLGVTVFITGALLLRLQ
jgi:streptogramin lyase